jgi:hypothetical protein
VNASISERLAAALAACAVTFSLLLAVVAEAGTAPHDRVRLVEGGRSAPCPARAS